MTDGIVLNLERIATATPNRAAIASLTRSTELALAGPMLSVTQKPAAAPGGTLNDYWSIGTYWWPDPAKADGVPYLRRDGHVNPEVTGGRYDRGRLAPFCSSIATLSLAALVGARADFAANAVERLRTWFIHPATRMNPNLRFGQSIPGHCDGRGIGIIDTHDLIGVVEACVMLRQIGALADSDHHAIVDWFDDYLEWLQTHEYGIAEEKEHNNHGTWYDAQAAAFALFTDQPEIARKIITAVPARRIDTQIEPDGRQPHELARTRSLAYSSMNLNGFFALAWMGRHVGVDLWSYRSNDGRSLRGAMDFLAPYAAADRPWPFPELEAEAHLPPARTRLFGILRQAANVWGEERYGRLADACEPMDGQDFSGIRFPRG